MWFVLRSWLRESLQCQNSAVEETLNMICCTETLFTVDVDVFHDIFTPKDHEASGQIQGFSTANPSPDLGRRCNVSVLSACRLKCLEQWSLLPTSSQRSLSTQQHPRSLRRRLTGARNALKLILSDQAPVGPEQPRDGARCNFTGLRHVFLEPPGHVTSYL